MLERQIQLRRRAKVQTDPNVAPQTGQTPSANTRLTRKSRERQPTKRCQECLKHERESCKAPPYVETNRSVHTCLSRGVPADHEARRQVKRNTAAKVKFLAHKKSAENSIAWRRPRAGQTEKVVRTREGPQRATVTREALVVAMKQIFQSEKSDDRETRGSMTTQRCWTNQRITPWQSTTQWCWRPPTNRSGNESHRPRKTVDHVVVHYGAGESGLPRTNDHEVAQTE